MSFTWRAPCTRGSASCNPRWWSGECPIGWTPLHRSRRPCCESASACRLSQCHEATRCHALSPIKARVHFTSLPLSLGPCCPPSGLWHYKSYTTHLDSYLSSHKTKTCCLADVHTPGQGFACEVELPQRASVLLHQVRSSISRKACVKSNSS